MFCSPPGRASAQLGPGRAKILRLVFQVTTASQQKKTPLFVFTSAPPATGQLLSRLITQPRDWLGRWDDILPDSRIEQNTIIPLRANLVSFEAIRPRCNNANAHRFLLSGQHAFGFAAILRMFTTKHLDMLNLAILGEIKFEDDCDKVVDIRSLNRLRRGRHERQNRQQCYRLTQHAHRPNEN
jgi:hypothetical protein